MLIREQRLNTILLESYKDKKEQINNQPILGSFKVKGMTAENVINQNGRLYPTEAWQSDYAFKKGGRYLDENGKVRPLTLLGNLDHPRADQEDGQVYLTEAAITWTSVVRNDDGTYDGEADILDTPKGKIVKVFLDYARNAGSADLLGVSSRAEAETTYVESNGTQVERINPDTFSLVSFDFVYDPSFSSAKAVLNESKGNNKKLLLESIQKLAKEDTKNASVYNSVLNDLIKSENSSLDKAKEVYLKSLRDEEKSLHDTIYDIESMSDEEYAKTKLGEKYSRKVVLKKLKKEYEDLVNEIKSEESRLETVSEAKKVIKENEETDDNKDKGNPDNSEQEPTEPNDKSTGSDDNDNDSNEDNDNDGQEDNPEDNEEPSQDVSIESLYTEVESLKSMLETILSYFEPIDDLGNPEDNPDEEEPTDDNEEDSEEPTEDNEEDTSNQDFLSSLSDEDLDNLSDEELEILLNELD